ncbi:hypothetical protein, partial [Mesorhizobium sp.]|uniref:hypothetical protein n=1 Tax=Mesorhizobium sp. TaxID=1871066 RepID=UPI002579C76E
MTMAILLASASIFGLLSSRQLCRQSDAWSQIEGQRATRYLRRRSDAWFGSLLRQVFLVAAQNGKRRR